MYNAYRKKLEERTLPFLKTCDIFKEARKNAREVARITGYWGQIKKVVEKKDVSYVVTLGNDFDYYVHVDGRVCKVEDLEKEKREQNRHPEKKVFLHPFKYSVENRKKEEDKKAYRMRMSIQCD